MDVAYSAFLKQADVFAWTLQLVAGWMFHDVSMV
jgi:hypothetical protein